MRSKALTLLVPIVAFCLETSNSGGALVPSIKSVRRVLQRPTLTQGSRCFAAMKNRHNRDESHDRQKEPKKYPPSRFVLDEAGNKWRLCAGSAVLNSDNHLLVGERVHIPDAWQAPQGGVDDAWEENDHQPESVVDAARRELYEEMGLLTNKHVMVESINDKPKPLRYETKGTGSWLTKSGFSGQELHWSVFRCIDGRGDRNASIMCDLNGKNGEAAEFVRVKWEPIEAVVENMWPAKRGPYESLRDALQPVTRNWIEHCTKLDFTGKWSRDSSLCTGLVEGLMARGVSRDRAEVETQKPYIQTWSRDGSDTTTWKVTTFDVDGITVRRELEYKVGEWEEKFDGNSVLASSLKDAALVQRRTAFVAEPESEPSGIAHSTISETPLGTEESRRYFKGDLLILRRTLWPSQLDAPAVVSSEVFVREQR